jgi:hypothetical protein
MTESVDATVASVAAVLGSALFPNSEEPLLQTIPSSHPTNLGDRPDQGVNCRILASLFPSIRHVVLSHNSASETIFNGIRAVNAFVVLGIVNPRSVPSFLMARYVLSCDDEDVSGLLNTHDLNMFAIRGISAIEPQMVRYTISSFFGLVEDRLSPTGVVSEIYRTVEMCFPELNQSKRIISKEGSRYCMDYCVDQLVRNSVKESELVTIFLVCVLIIGATSCGRVESVLDDISGALGVSDDSRSLVLRYILSRLRDTSRDKMCDRFGLIEGLVMKFKAGKVEDTDDPRMEQIQPLSVSRKRTRQSVALTKGKRRRKNVKQEKEYTSGDSSSSDHENVDN